MASVDSLSILITASTASAKSRIDALTESLKALSGAIAGLDVSKFETLANAVDRLGDGLSGIPKGAAKDIQKISDAVKTSSEEKSPFEGVKKGVEEVAQKSKEAVTGVEQIDQTLKSVDPVSIDGMSDSLQKASSVMDRTTSKMSAFKSMLVGLKIIIPTDSLVKVDKQIAKTTEKLEELRDKLNYKSSHVEGYVDSKDMEKDQEKIAGLINELDRLKLKKQELEANGGFKLNLKETFSGVHETISKVNKKLASFASHMFKAKSATRDTAKSTKSFGEAAKKLTKSLTKVTKMLKLMITRMALRTVIKETGNGFKSLALHCAEFDNAMSSVMNSSKKLAYSFAGMVEPLVKALAPALLYIIGLINKLINAFAQLFAALGGGGTWHKAKDFTGKWSDDIKDANKQAKELKKTVLGFDELNQLQDNKNSGGGGTSPLDMFEEAPIDSKWADWAKKIKDMWKKGDFTELGSAIGQWLLNALESIPWTKIKARAYKAGKSLATLLNGIIETPKLGKTLGKSLAEAINTAVLFVNGFVRNFHWDSLGKFIGEMFNGFFENIDWYYIKDTVVTGLRGLAFAIQNFIDTFHWDNISKTVVNALDTLSAGIKAFFENIDWGDLGKKFGTQLRKIIKETDWKQIGEAIGDIIQAAIDFVSETISQLSWEDIKNAISDLFEGFFSKVDKGKISAAIVGLLSSAAILAMGKLTFTTAKSLLGEVIKKKLITAFGGQVVANAAAQQMGGAVTSAAGSTTVTTAAGAAGASIGTQILAGLGAAFAGQQIGTEIGKWIFPDDAELYDKYKGISGFFQEIKDLGTSTVDFLKMTFSGELTSADFWEGLSAEEQKLYSVLKVHYGEELPQHIQQTIDQYGNASVAMQHLKEEAQKISDETQSKIDALRNKADDANKSISKIYDTTAAENLKNMKEQTDSIKESLNHIADTKAAEGLKRMRESANFGAIKQDAQELETTLNNTKKSVNDATTGIEQDWTGTQQEVSNAVETMSLDISSGMTDIQTSVTQSTDEIMKSFDTIKDGMTKEKWTFDGVSEGLKETFRRAKEGIKSEWNQIANTLNGNHTVGTSSININLPKFANGGFPENGLFMANSTEMVGKFSNGRNAVANNEQITDGIAQAVYSAMMSANAGGSTQYINNTIQIDGQTIARAVTKGQKSLDRRYSPTMA